MSPKCGRFVSHLNASVLSSFPVSVVFFYVWTFLFTCSAFNLGRFCCFVTRIRNVGHCVDALCGGTDCVPLTIVTFCRSFLFFPSSVQSCPAPIIKYPVKCSRSTSSWLDIHELMIGIFHGSLMFSVRRKIQYIRQSLKGENAGKLAAQKVTLGKTT